MINIKVPATTANMGPGFDALGMALSQYSYFQCEKSNKIEVIVEGLESEKLTVENNLVVDSMNHLFKYINRKPEGYKLKIINGIPLARGMGSSASAIVGGLMCANALMDFPLEKEELLKLATEIEGHPDNVAPALFGNIIVSAAAPNGEIIYKSIDPFKGLECVLFIPEYEVSTKDSRNVLPKEISMVDTVHNCSNLALMVIGFINGDKTLIGKTMNDRIHEPYRKKLIKKYDEIKSIALKAGAFAFSLSGAGSTVIAYTTDEESEKVKLEIESIAKINNIDGKIVIVKPCSEGAVYEI